MPNVQWNDFKRLAQFAHILWMTARLSYFFCTYWNVHWACTFIAHCTYIYISVTEFKGGRTEDDLGLRKSSKIIQGCPFLLSQFGMQGWGRVLGWERRRRSRRDVGGAKSDASTLVPVVSSSGQLAATLHTTTVQLHIHRSSLLYEYIVKHIYVKHRSTLNPAGDWRNSLVLGLASAHDQLVSGALRRAKLSSLLWWCL